MGTVRYMTRCPTTGASASTGVLGLRTELAAPADERSFRCDACGAVHHWTADAAWLEEITFAQMAGLVRNRLAG